MALRNIAVRSIGFKQHAVIRIHTSYFHTTLSVAATVDKASLSQLRKRTGYPFINCRKALLQFGNDVCKAEEWLNAEAQKQGWAKATKLEGRPMSQGLVGVIVDGNVGAMVEISCETDFVARNAKFHSLVEEVSDVCLKKERQNGSKKVYWHQSALGQLAVAGGQTVADLVAVEVGSLGENMQARRGVFFRAPETYQLTSYVHKAGINVHGSGSCEIGKYGALLSYRRAAGRPDQDTRLEDLGRQLCQHIVGMNPECIGSPEDEPCKDPEDETKLIHQEFLLDADIRVSEYLERNGIEVQDYVRFECGGD